MKKTLLPIIAAALVLLSACQEDGSTVSLDGSTSMERVIGALTEGYREMTPGVTINSSGTGSGAGIEAVLSGMCDIGLSSRPLSNSEIAKGAEAHLIALDAIAVIVNGDNPLSDLTPRQLQDIFTGSVVNWAQLGGLDAPVAVYGREAGSGTRSAFEDLLGATDLCAYTNEYSSNGDIALNVAANPNAIGYVSLSGVVGSVKALQISGVPCTEETILSGSYSLQRPFLLVTSSERPLSPPAQAFLDYAMSSTAADYISIAGAVAPNHMKG